MYLYEVSVVLLISLCLTGALPQQQKSKRPIPIFKKKTEGLLLPNNATSIRENIVDTFSCDERIYGYYADTENECQVFHVCMPQEEGDGTMRWSFICPSETVFNQATFVCTRTESSIPCEESENYYSLNEEFGKVEEEEEEEESEKPEESTNDVVPDKVSPLPTARSLRRGKSRSIAETTVELRESEVTVPSTGSAALSSKSRA